MIWVQYKLHLVCISTKKKEFRLFFRKKALIMVVNAVDKSSVGGNTLQVT